MKLKYKFTAAFLALLISFSCDESYLEIAPYGSVSESTLANEQGLDKLLIGAYSLLDGGGTVGGNYTIGIGRLRGGDEVTQGTETGPSIYNAMLFDENDGAIHDRWRNLYSAVGRTNDVLRMLSQVEAASPDKLVQIEAEARFLRGVYYLYLAMFYKNVPWVDETITYARRTTSFQTTRIFFPKSKPTFPSRRII